MDYSFENEAMAQGYGIVCGTDEAGRGPLAGSVYAAAVILPLGYEIEGLNDSKKLTEKKREKLFDIIVRDAVSYGIAEATAKEIDELNILNASLLAMRRAIAMLDPQPDLVLVDGNQTRGFTIPARAIVKGDALSPSIAAASILAKVSRDRSCLELDRLYPEYGFAKHKGYPTKDHYEAIRLHGITPEHRRSFTLYK
jgi:ribonuclease HII